MATCRGPSSGPRKDASMTRKRSTSADLSTQERLGETVTFSLAGPVRVVCNGAMGSPANATSVFSPIPMPKSQANLILTASSVVAMRSPSKDISPRVVFLSDWLAGTVCR